MTEKENVDLNNRKVKRNNNSVQHHAFLENFANELKAPVNVIAGFTALLSEPDVDEETRESYLGIMREAGDNLMSMAYDLQEISNIENGQVIVEKQNIKLNFLLRNLHDSFLKRAVNKKIDLSLEFLDRINEIEILADRGKLTKVLSNLISNAVKFTAAGSVRFGYRVKDDFIEFHISDTGIGIHNKYFESIFDRNFRSENPVMQSYGGTGLGLAISKAYIELMGGRVFVSSTVGSGSVFRFTLPLEKGVPTETESEDDKYDEFFNFSVRKTILVAEDTDSNYMLIRFFLKNLNIELVRAVNGQEAVERALASKEFDLILMDFKMPVMDGLTAARIIRENGSEVPIIAQTAYIYDKQKAIESGCNGFITKPFDKKKLINEIREFLG